MPNLNDAIDRASEAGGYLKAMDQLIDQNDCIGTVYLILDKLKENNAAVLADLKAVQTEVQS